MKPTCYTKTNTYKYNFTGSVIPLKSKLINPHVILKQTLINITLSTCVVPSNL